MTARNLILLGCGQSAKALLENKRGIGEYGHVYATTRSAERFSELRRLGAEPILFGHFEADSKFSEICHGADILVSFPPDGRSDAFICPLLSEARRIIYISSTGVYGGAQGLVNEDTAVERTEDNAKRLDAEELWSAAGAVILRAPGLYNAHSGLHIRLLAGSYRPPPNPANFVSRIHLDDLATIILACFAASCLSRSIYVVGDLKPCPHDELVSFLCSRLNLPATRGQGQVSGHHTLRGNRRVDPTRILKELGIQLKYPTYVEGYGQCLQAGSS